MLNRIICALATAIMCLAILASTAFADYLADITVSRSSPSSLQNNWWVEVACDWEFTGSEEDVIIEAVPMTNGSVSPSAVIDYAHGSGPGSGRVWPRFSIQSGDVWVDEVRLSMKVGDPVYETVLEVSIPVSIHFGPHSFRSIDIDFEPPQQMQIGQNVTIDLVWETNHVGGHRMVIRPMTNGFYSPNLGTGGSGVLTGTEGAATRWFTILEDPVDVDSIVFELYNADWSELIYEFILPAEYHFDTTAIQNIEMYWESPASIVHGDEVTITFDYRTDFPMDPIMYAVPQTGGVHSPGFTLGPSYPLAPGFGSGTNTFSIDASGGMVDVDEILFSLHDFFDEGTIIHQLRLPVYYHYAESAIWNVAYEPLPPAILGNDTYLNVEITYFNGHDEQGWLVNTPLSAGVPASNLDGNLGSVALPWMNPPNTHNFTVTVGNQLVDGMHFEMFTLDQEHLWLSYFQDVWFHFGSSALVSPVVDVPGAVAPSLDDCFPNPFNPLTTIRFDLPTAMDAEVKLYDLRGRLIKTLVSRQVMNAGSHDAIWNGKDEAGRSVAAGVYIYRLEAGEVTAAKRMTLVK